MSDLYISSIISQAWEIFKERWFASIGLAFLPMLIGFGYSFASVNVSESMFWLYFLVYMMLQLTLGIVMIRGFLVLARQQELDFSQLIPSVKDVFNYLGTLFLSMLIIFGGLILLVLPGLYFIFKYFFAAYLCIDQKLGPREALRQSAAMTKGVKWDVFGFTFVMGLVMYLGILALGVGLLISMPVAMLGYVLFYERLRARIAEPQTTDATAAASTPATA